MSTNQSMSMHVKYRPKRFKDVIGHKAMLKQLRKTVKANRSHAFMFTGPAGIGKTTLARILANEFCDGDASAANIEEIAAAVNTGVDVARQIIDRTHYKVVGKSKNRIIIIDEAHRLSGNAWDSLLKAIEEPPSHVYYMFCTTVVGKIPKTILTRCYHVDLAPLSENEIMEVLAKAVKGENLEVEVEVLEAIAESSGGSARQALVFLESCMYCESANEARKAMKQASGETKEVVDLCRLLISRRKPTWTDCMKTLKAIEGMDAESIRIVINNYFANAIVGSKSEKDAVHMMSVLDCFSQPYYPADKFAPLILSIGEALEMGG